MKTAAVYIRVSTEDQTEHSPDSQLKEIKNYAERHGLLIDPAYIFTDAGISGRKAARRPEFQRMISIAKNKPSPFEVLLVWKFSRFARNQEESILYKSLLNKECGVDVVSITEETNDSVFGSLIERIIEWMDEFYSVRLSEEVRTKMTFVAEKGKIQTTPPYGYSKKPGETMQIVPDEAQWIRFIFNEYLNGKSMLSISTYMNEHGAKTHRGNRFENRTIEYILRNPMYCGYVRWTPTGRTVGKRIFDSDDTITVKGDFEPIISEDLFKQVQDKIKAKKANRKKRERSSEYKKHWLTGIATCHSCGDKLYYQSAHDAFQCHGYTRGKCKTSHYISAKKLEDTIVTSLSTIEIDERFVEENKRPVQLEEKYDYTPLITKLEKQLERAKAAYLEGFDTIDEYSSNKKKITAQIDYFKAEMKKMLTTETPDVEEVKKEYKNILELIKSDAAEDIKHDAITKIVEKCVYTKGSGIEESIDIFFHV